MCKKTAPGASRNRVHVKVACLSFQFQCGACVRDEVVLGSEALFDIFLILNVIIGEDLLEMFNLVDPSHAPSPAPSWLLARLQLDSQSQVSRLLVWRNAEVLPPCLAAIWLVHMIDRSRLRSVR